MARLRIGASGWAYRHWKGDFYPQGLKAREEFAWYAGQFDTVEINAAFYRMPSPEAVAAWRGRAPGDFLFAWKASRYITHMKRLKDAAEPLELLFGRARGLGPHLGPMLFQLPPMMRPNLERLAAFVAQLPRDLRCALEFRDPGWYAPAVFDLLAAHDCALVISDHHHAPAPWAATASFAYVRGHGPGGAYRGDYGEATLRGWAAQSEAWLEEGRDVYVYFDNDIGGAAPRDAHLLKRLTGQTA